MVLAARERDLELSPEALHVRMTEQEERHRIRVGRDVERLVAAHADERARRHVADGVAARLARRDADCREPPHEIRRVLYVDEVELNVLPRGHVEDPVGVLLGELGDRVELVGAELAVGDLDSHHPGRIPHRHGALRELARRERQHAALDAVVALPVVVALTVDTAPEPGLGEELLLDLPLLAEDDLRLERVDLLGPCGRHGAPQLFLPSARHGSFPSTSRLYQEASPRRGADLYLTFPMRQVGNLVTARFVVRPLSPESPFLPCGIAEPSSPL